MNKNKYTSPDMQVIAIRNMEGLLQTLSLKQGTTPATGGGDAKPYTPELDFGDEQIPFE